MKKTQITIGRDMRGQYHFQRTDFLAGCQIDPKTVFEVDEATYCCWRDIRQLHARTQDQMRELVLAGNGEPEEPIPDAFVVMAKKVWENLVLLVQSPAATLTQEQIEDACIGYLTNALYGANKRLDGTEP